MGWCQYPQKENVELMNDLEFNQSVALYRTFVSRYGIDTDFYLYTISGFTDDLKLLTEFVKWDAANGRKVMT